MKNHFDFIVLGLGGIGSGALYWLARSGAGSLLGLEQFEIGHVRGGSEDHSRIIRLSYHTPAYVELAKEAYEAWAALAADAGEDLVVKTGGLDLFPVNAAIPQSDYTNSMDAAGVPYERLDAAEVMRRWPQFRLDEDVTALYQAESGIAPAAKCNAAHLRLARAYGAQVRHNAPVTAVTPHPHHVTITAGGETFTCQKLIVTAGAWSNPILAHFGVQLNLTVTQEQVTYYQSPRPADFTPDRFPVWIWMDEPSFYGFPVYGENGLKAAQDAGGREVTADSRSFTPDAENQARVDGFVRRVLPGAFGPYLLRKTCLYTMPPDRDFVLDMLPAYPHVAVAIGAGHAFKFASVLGRILSELAVDGHPADGRASHDLAPFSVKRPILTETNPVKQFLV